MVVGVCREGGINRITTQIMWRILKELANKVKEGDLRMTNRKSL